MKTKQLTLTALFAAVLCISAPWSVPVGPIPLSLATFAVYLAAAVGGRKIGTGATVVYLLLGAAGLPVFSGFSGGLGKIMNVTGGYLLGYVPCAWICGMFFSTSWKKWKYPVGMLLGTAALYWLGTAWYAQCAKVSFVRALSVCVLPFLPGDFLKIVLASFLGPKLKKIAKTE